MRRVRSTVRTICFTTFSIIGKKEGFANEALRVLSDSLTIPVIASGGAGTCEHFYDALTEGGADAALAASLFHFKELEIREVKEYLDGKGVPVRI